MMHGILVGCDSVQEWLLPWWHRNLHKHQPEVPIAFGDFGMSEEARRWCAARGSLIPASQIPALKENEIPWLYEGRKWSSETSTTANIVSFRKPFLMQLSPFERTIWLDLDCEVLGDLSPLFSMRLLYTKFAVMVGQTQFNLLSEDKKHSLKINHVNSGVAVFEKGSQLLDFWAEFLQLAYSSFLGDDWVLGFVLSKYRFPVNEIPFAYNWQVSWGNHRDAIIVHWSTPEAKAILKKETEAKSSFSYRQFPLLALEQELQRARNS